MYDVEEFLEQADQASDDDLERVEDQNDEAEEATENKDEEEGSAKKVPKKVRKPSNRPKLDVERLKGPRGLATIEKLFEKVQFKGNGHEHEDLHAVMGTLQYWCHRLFPKYSFDDCLEHLEKLGTKKPLITLKKKILFDLFDDDQPTVNDDEEDNINNPETQEAISEFDLLLQQEPISTLSQQRPVTPERIELTEEQKETMERNRLLAIERRKARLEALQLKQAQNESLLQNSDNELTEEQKALIERNRQIALEKRRTKNHISINSSLVPSSQGDASTVEKPDFNELVDSFFPSSTDDNPEDNTEKSDVGDDVDINDLIEEINPIDQDQIQKPVTENNEMNVDGDSIDINNLLEETTENNDQKQVEDNRMEKNQIEINNEKNVDYESIDINNLLEESTENNDQNQVEDNRMDVDQNTEKNVNENDESIDINNLLEETTVNNDQKQVEDNRMDQDQNPEKNRIEINNQSIDINNLLEETTENNDQKQVENNRIDLDNKMEKPTEVNNEKTEINNQKQVEDNRMDQDQNTTSSDNINSPREDTTANLLETE